MTVNRPPEKETPPEGGVGPEMLSPAGLVSGILSNWFAAVKRSFPQERFGMQRVIVYVDGFNLYFGLKASGFKRYYWLNIAALAQNLLKPGQQLCATHYFTTRIRGNGRNTADQKRQNDYLEALAMHGVLCHFGHYL